MSYRKLISEDQCLITYRPALREIGGSVAGTVLLQQIIYWDEKAGGKFYKFSSPCSHSKYNAGDSWEEELGMSQKEIRTALHHFAFKCGKKNRETFEEDYEELREKALVQYYTDSDRVTWYLLNRKLLCKLLYGIYKESDQPEFIIYTETNTETTTDIVADAPACDLEEKEKLPTPKPKQPQGCYPPNKPDTPPTAAEVRAWAEGWAKKKGKNPATVCRVAEEARVYYDRLDWKDSQGKKVMAWKQKIVAVWFKDDKLTGTGGRHIDTSNY